MSIKITHAWRWPNELPMRSGGPRQLRTDIQDVMTLERLYSDSRERRWYETKNAYELWEHDGKQVKLISRVSRPRIAAIYFHRGPSWRGEQ